MNVEVLNPENDNIWRVSLSRETFSATMIFLERGSAEGPIWRPQLPGSPCGPWGPTGLAPLFRGGSEGLIE